MNLKKISMSKDYVVIYMNESEYCAYRNLNCYKSINKKPYKPLLNCRYLVPSCIKAAEINTYMLCY